MANLADLERARYAHTSRNGTVILTRPSRRFPFVAAPAEPAAEPVTAKPTDTTGPLLVIAALLLLALAVAMGIVSWHAQYAFVLAIKHQRMAATFEALGLDAATVVFSVLGIVLARLGRRAVVERVLVCLCAAGSAGMNLAGADLGSPRSVAAYVMPPVLFAITSDRLIAVIRRAALGPDADRESQRSAWQVGGLAALYLLRLVVAPWSTLRGGRQALLNATPLPELPGPAAAVAIEAPRPAAGASSKPSRRSGSRGPKPGTTKTQRLLDLVAERHGPLAEFPLTDVSRVATGIAPEVGIHAGSARSALRAAVLAAQDGGQR